MGDMSGVTGCFLDLQTTSDLRSPRFFGQVFFKVEEFQSFPNLGISYLKSRFLDFHGFFFIALCHNSLGKT